MTAVIAPPGATSTTAAAPGDDVGTVIITDTVVAKLAARAALEIDDAGGAARRVLGRVLPGAGHLSMREDSLDTAPQVSADVDGSVAFVDLTISVRWPASVPQVTAEVRDRVMARIQELTDLTVAQVHIHVAALVTDTPPPRVH